MDDKNLMIKYAKQKAEAACSGVRFLKGNLVELFRFSDPSPVRMTDVFLQDLCQQTGRKNSSHQMLCSASSLPEQRRRSLCTDCLRLECMEYVLSIKFRMSFFSASIGTSCHKQICLSLSVVES